MPKVHGRNVAAVKEFPVRGLGYARIALMVGYRLAAAIR
jgi:hypothetical protein